MRERQLGSETTAPVNVRRLGIITREHVEKLVE